MSEPLIPIPDLSEAFKKKTTAILAIGVLLMIVSMYISSTNPDVGNIGIYTSIVIILFALGISLLTKKQIE